MSRRWVIPTPSFTLTLILALGAAQVVAFVSAFLLQHEQNALAVYAVLATSRRALACAEALRLVRSCLQPCMVALKLLTGHDDATEGKFTVAQPLQPWVRDSVSHHNKRYQTKAGLESGSGSLMKIGMLYPGLASELTAWAAA